MLCKAGGEEFVGGLCNRGHLIPSMCWRLQQADEMVVRGPSWTWGSRSGLVSYELTHHPAKMMPKPSIVSVDINSDKSHSNISGSITLKGFLGACEPDSSHSSTGFGAHFATVISKWFDDASESRGNLYIFDMLESEKNPKYLILLRY